MQTVTRACLLLLLITMLTACIGDPIYSIKHTVSFDGSMSHECISAAGNSIKGVSILKIEDLFGPRDLDEYSIHYNKTNISALWFKSDRNRIELSTMGIGYGDEERDLNVCHLIRLF